ncbi:MAG: acetyl-CoA carboxylase biotin carboxylase subunit [Christensenellales bacterium]|jgi:acetyl-CoA carboxylase biotin carboxylase subunit
MIKKILVANRGEIAVRIIRACRDMGIESVAVYSLPDESSLHAQLADEAICIGPAAAKDSYLNPYNILSAAFVTGADAIHPGYGFLAENPKFVEMCRKCGMVFIGPDASSMEKAGNKLFARRMMHKVDVPIIPGTLEPLASVEEALCEAEKTGYPVMIKAAAGGGGRGIRKVLDGSGMRAAFEAAGAEALAAFGDGTLYLEKCMDDARHIEVQLLFDNFGKGVYLFERECSLQWRNQKVMEEAPSPGIGPELRKEIGRAALRAAKALDYKNAGTIEFLMDMDGNFYFMELNARIQVEHPVTEMITGMDIVKEQIKIAAGEPFAYKQSDIKMSGHAIECRINAEDPSKGFLPSSGAIRLMHLPGGPGVRVDTALYVGCEVPPYYDSMIAKLIVHGQDRDQAMAKMRSALSELMIDGVETNVDFQIDLLTHPEVMAGALDTGLVGRIMEECDGLI